MSLIASMSGIALADTPADPPQSGSQEPAIVGVDAAIPYTESERAQKWEQLKFGMFIHWGVYSNLGGYYKGQRQPLGYPEQIKAWMKISDEDYLKVAADMSAPNFDAAQWCQTAKDAGMKYLLITSKHHDGFAMWDTKTTDYNVVDKTDLGIDPLEELSQACTAIGLKFAVYFSIIDWTQHEAEPYSNMNPIPESMMPYIKSQLTELMTKYGEIAEVWFDMGAPTADQSKRMADWVHELQPNAMVSSRVWNQKGDFEVGGDNAVFTQKRQAPWEAARSTFPACWGYCKFPEVENVRNNPARLPYQISHEVNNLFTTVANGGQYLLNVGPKGTGEMDPFEVNVLKGVGEWNKAHPAILDGSRYDRFPTEDWGYSVVNGDAVYLGVKNWQPNQTIQLRGLASPVKSVTIDGTDTQLPYTVEGTTLTVTLKGNSPDANLPIIKVSTDGKPLYVSPKTALSENGKFTAGKEGVESMNSTISYAGAVSHTFYVASKGKAVKNAKYVVKDERLKPNTKYAVTVGDTRTVKTGEELSAGIEIGDLPANKVVPVTLALAEPPYYATPLGLSNNFNMSIEGTPVEIVTPQAPTVVEADKCGVEATVSLPEQKGVEYTTEKNGTTVVVTASATDGYMVADGATVEWKLSVAAKACPPPVKPADQTPAEKKPAEGKYKATGKMARTGAQDWSALIALTFIAGAAAIGFTSRKRS